MKIFQYVVLLPAEDIVSVNVYFLLTQNYWEKNYLKKNWDYNNFERINLTDRLGIPYRKESTLVRCPVQSSLPMIGLTILVSLLRYIWPMWCRFNSSSGQSILVALPLENSPTTERFLETYLFLFMVFSNEVENSLFPSSLQQFLIYLKTYYIYSPNNPNFFSHSL